MIGVAWEDYARNLTLTTVIGGMTAFLSFTNTVRSTVYRVEQVTMFTLMSQPTLMAISLGINGQPTTGVIASTSQFTAAAVNGNLTAAVAVAISPPFWYLQPDDTGLIFSVIGAQTGDQFGAVVEYTIGTTETDTGYYTGGY